MYKFLSRIQGTVCFTYARLFSKWDGLWVWVSFIVLSDDLKMSCCCKIWDRRSRKANTMNRNCVKHNKQEEPNDTTSYVCWTMKTHNNIIYIYIHTYIHMYILCVCIYIYIYIWVYTIYIYTYIRYGSGGLMPGEANEDGIIPWQDRTSHYSIDY